VRNALDKVPKRPEHVVRLAGQELRLDDQHTNVCTRYRAPMNITFALDESLVSAAKATAARHGTSISALVRTALE